MMKKIKLLIVFVTALVMTTVITLSANTGYTYDHRGEPIYSTVGFTINQTPYLANDLGIESTKFTNPRDLFVYTDEEGNDIIYIVDGSSNALFVFNDSFELKREINSFTLDPTKINESVLREVKTGGQYLIARDQI